MPGDNGATELGLDGVYSHSQVQNYLSCEQRYAYQYRDGFLAPRASRPMTLGTTGHHLLDEWWVGKDISSFDLDEITEFVISLEETQTIEECASIADHALWLLRRYDKMYAGQREKVEILDVERTVTFELPQLGERRFGMVAKIDKLMSSREHGGTVFMDHKFVGKRDKSDTLDIDSQFTTYFLALRETGIDITVALLDSVYTYRNKRKGEFLEWDDKAIPVEESFSRIPTDRTPAALDVHARDLYRACERMWNLRQTNHEPLRNVGFACPSCSFRAPCYEALQGDADSERALLEEHFSPLISRTPVSSSVSQEEEVFLP